MTDVAARKIQLPVHGSRCDARSRPRTTRIVRGHHDYGSEWSLLAAGRGHLHLSCLSAALGVRGRQWMTAEAPRSHVCSHERARPGELPMRRLAAYGLRSVHDVRDRID